MTGAGSRCAANTCTVLVRSTTHLLHAAAPVPDVVVSAGHAVHAVLPVPAANCPTLEHRCQCTWDREHARDNRGGPASAAAVAQSAAVDRLPTHSSARSHLDITCMACKHAGSEDWSTCQGHRGTATGWGNRAHAQTHTHTVETVTLHGPFTVCTSSNCMTSAMCWCH
jgi:hypothetical protein